MSSARVVFADGSKQMAHNTDDLMLRWQERVATSREDITRQHRNGIYIRDCSECQSLEQAREWQKQLLIQIGALENQCEVLKAECFTAEYERLSFPLRTAMVEIRTQLAILRGFIRDATTRQQQENAAEKHARKLERIAQANSADRQQKIQMHRAFVALYRAVESGDYIEIQGAMAKASEFMPVKKSGDE